MGRKNPLGFVDCKYFGEHHHLSVFLFTLIPERFWNCDSVRPKAAGFVAWILSQA
jgi:hypothetical protein